MADGPRIMSYALGGGMGHVTRALAFLRQARRLLGAEVRALTNSPHAHRLEAEGISVARLPDGREWNADTLADWVLSEIRAFDPDVFTVDAFPRGILGEMGLMLPHVECPKVAILRRLREDYVERYGVGDFVRRSYDAAAFVEDVGEPLTTGVGDRATKVMPVIVRDADELLSRDGTRVRLGAEPDQPLVLAVASGSSGQAGAFAGAVRRAWRRLGQPGVIRSVGVGGGAAWEDPAVRLGGPIRPTIAQAGTPFDRLRARPVPPGCEGFPLIELLPGVDLVIGAAGYNLFHEVHAVGVPAILLPQNRLYDDQFGRARGARVAHDPEELESFMADALRNWQVPRGEPSYANGAVEVVSLLAELAARRTSRR